MDNGDSRDSFPYAHRLHIILKGKTNKLMQESLQNTPNDTLVTAITRTIETNMKQYQKEGNQRFVSYLNANGNLLQQLNHPHVPIQRLESLLGLTRQGYYSVGMAGAGGKL